MCLSEGRDKSEGERFVQNGKRAKANGKESEAESRVERGRRDKGVKKER